MTNLNARSRGIYNMERGQALASLQHGEPMLYAMRVADGLIKIGCSRDVSERRRCLTGELLAMMPGDFDSESDLHDDLAPHAHHGREWYNPTPEVIAVVNEMRNYYHLSPI